MHTHSLAPWQHSHVYVGRQEARNERRTWFAVGLTVVTMLIEIVAGSLFNSMALLADGWHMATHAGALAIAALAYRYARRHAGDARFSFGTGKVGDLAAFASAVVLGIVALLVAWESFWRLNAPAPIRFDQAIAVAVLGLAVNLVSAGLLWERPAAPEHDHHAHDHARPLHPHHHHADNNLRAALLHVLADAVTSVLAIGALLAGQAFGLVWLDPLIGLLGAVVIARWSWGLLRDAGRVLVDATADPALAREIRAAIETGSEDRISDLHLWRIAPGRFAAIVSIVSHGTATADDFRARLAGHPELVHLTVEVRPCHD